jgi:hypothetical protein
MFKELVSEKKETPDYRLNITVHRHGPKQGLAGGLSETGKEETAQYFEEAYENITPDLPEGQSVDLEHSPINRAEETIDLDARHSGQKIRSKKVDERLSEGRIAYHEDVVNQLGGKGGRWTSKWVEMDERPLPDIKTGKEAAQGFAEWLLEKIYERKKLGGEQEIDAASHGPAMVAMLYALEKEVKTQLLPLGWEKTTDYSQLINYLEYFNVYTDSDNPEIIKLTFKGQNVEFSLGVLKKIAGKEK